MNHLAGRESCGSRLAGEGLVSFTSLLADMPLSCDRGLPLAGSHTTASATDFMTMHDLAGASVAQAAERFRNGGMISFHNAHRRVLQGLDPAMVFKCQISVANSLHLLLLKIFKHR